MSNYTELQKYVIKMAKSKIKNEKWYRGICLDKLPETDQEINKIGVESVISDLVIDTAFYDGTTYF